MNIEISKEMNREIDRDQIIQYCCKALLDKGLNANQYMGALTLINCKYTCIKIAVLARNKSLILQLLVHHKVDIKNTSNGDMPIFSYLFSLLNGSNINTQIIEIIELLLEHGADIHTRIGNRTLLMDMAYRLTKIDNYESVTKLLQILCEGGLDINAIDKYGYTALIYLCRESSFYNKKIEFIQLLINYGADIFIRDDCNRDALMHVLINAFSTETQTVIPYSIIIANRNGLLELLIQNGADINAQDYTGKTPLYMLHFLRRGVSFEVHTLL